MSSLCWVSSLWNIYIFWLENTWFFHPSVASKISTLLTQLFSLSPLDQFRHVTHYRLGVSVLLGKAVVATLEEKIWLFEVYAASLSSLGMCFVLCTVSLSKSDFFHTLCSYDYRMIVFSFDPQHYLRSFP